ncbi:MAG: hypothetical protein H0U27_00055 [Nitrosopumilus sp.]|nr:hypothetical protein [Nitrosopumilus sp.]
MNNIDNNHEEEDELSENETDDEYDSDDNDGVEELPNEKESVSILQFCKAQEVLQEVAAKTKEKKEVINLEAKEYRKKLMNYMTENNKTCIPIMNATVIDGEKVKPVFIRIYKHSSPVLKSKTLPETIEKCLENINVEQLDATYQSFVDYHDKKNEKEKDKKPKKNHSLVTLEKKKEKKEKEPPKKKRKITLSEEPTFLNVFVEALKNNVKTECTVTRQYIQLTDVRERKKTDEPKNQKVKIKEKGKEKDEEEPLQAQIEKLPADIIITAKNLLKKTGEIRTLSTKLNEQSKKINASLGKLNEKGSHLNTISSYLNRVNSDKKSSKIIVGVDEYGKPIEKVLREKVSAPKLKFGFSQLPDLSKEVLEKVFATYHIDPSAPYDKKLAEKISAEMINKAKEEILNTICERSTNKNPTLRITLDKVRRSKN